MHMFLWVVPPGAEFDSAAEVLQAVASPLRLAILVHLDRRPMAVQELADRLGESQPLVSHHLGVLRRAGLVAVERAGRRAVYSTAASPVVDFAVAVVGLEQQGRTTMTTTGADAAEQAEHPAHVDHEHGHGEGCGHVAVPHGDHLDYAHDGHLHRAHGDHWDECEATAHVEHADHGHSHGEGCGHVAVAHGDHLDYVHDGHRHAAHDGHYDDH